MRLAQFQQSKGISFEDQIVLVNNRQMFHGFKPCFYPWSRVRPFQYLVECWRQKTVYGPKRLSLGKGLRTNKLFAGFFDRSFDHLDWLNPLFDFIRARSEQYKLVIGKGDYTITKEFKANVPENVSNVWANNVCIGDPQFSYLPMGRDFRSKHLFPDMMPTTTKTLLCYCNFSTSTHLIRQQLYDQIKKMDFIEFDHMGGFMNYTLSREQFFEKLAASKFSICPRGNAYDTFRMWDSLYVGTIPIVVREAHFHEGLLDLPILFLDSYQDFSNLSKDYLNDTYESMSKKHFNYEKLTSQYWLQTE